MDSSLRYTRRCPLRRSLRVEPLEDRLMLAITVTTLVDENNGVGPVSLREAIAAAAPDETINFAVAGTINLTLGELVINKNLTISGPGASVLTVNAQQASRIFDISGSAIVSIGGMTLTGGRAAASQNGGAIRSQSTGMLTIQDSIITGNAAGGGTTGFGGAGGGIWSSGPLSVINSTISGNRAGNGGVSALEIGFNGGNGGGIWASSTLAVINSHITANETGIGGDGGLSQGLPGDGGGVFIAAGGTASLSGSTLSANTGFRRGGGVASSGVLTAENTTFSGNIAGNAGGGVFVAAGHATLRYSTVTANLAAVDLGGGVASTGNETTLTEIHSTIVAGNTGSDVAFVTGAVNSFHSLAYNIIGTGNATGAFNQSGDWTNVANPLLASLANNGGPTPTHAPLGGSVAINRGDPAAVAGANGVPQFDQRGTPHSRILAGRIDVGAVERAPQTFVVNTLVDELDGSVDDGDVSLRDALAAAGHGDTITFSVTGVITLTGGELLVTKQLTIIGPGAKSLTIDASGNDPTPHADNGDGSRVIKVDDGTADVIAVSISGLTITGADLEADSGDIPEGGAIFNRENLTIDACEVHGNSVIGAYGGGLASFGPVVIKNSTFAQNIAGGGGGVSLSSTALVENSTIVGNTSYSDGGGALVVSGDTTFRHTTITGNTTLGAPGAGGGGGISAAGFSFAQVRLYSCIVAGNTGGDLDIAFFDQNPFVSLGYNVVGFGEAVDVFDKPGDRPYISDPSLGPLEDNGGQTRTRAPLPYSPAVDQGDPQAIIGQAGVPSFDQRGAGFTRAIGRMDVGAVESPHHALVVNTLVDEADGSIVDGDVSLRDALAAAPPFSLITFSVTGVIHLSLGELVVNRDVVIDGPGVDLLAIDASVKDPTPAINDGLGSRIFYINGGLGGAIDVSIRNLKLTGGDANASGGAILSFHDVLLYQTLVDDNFSLDRGGGIFAPGKVMLIRSTVSNNSTTSNLASGGGIFAGAGALIKRSTIAGNRTSGIESDGGGLLVIGDAEIVQSVVTGNSTAGQGADGAGITVVGNVKVVESTISGNVIEGNFAYGGGVVAFHTLISPGVYANGNVELINSTVSGNEILGANGDGGGIYAFGDVTLSQSTVSGNRVMGQFGYGGGIAVVGSATIANSTITNNHSHQGFAGGIFQGDRPTNESFSVTGSIIAGNTSGGGGPDIFRDPDGPLTVNYSLIGNTVGAAITAASGIGNLLNVPPLLGPLADNGGPTKTHALLAGSPAINAGDPAAWPGSDQRGQPFQRIVSGRIDMGALEQQPITPSADFNSDSHIDGLDFLKWQRHFGEISPNGVHADGDADFDHDVDAADFAIWKDSFGDSAQLAAAQSVAGSGIAVADGLTALSPQAVDAALAWPFMQESPAATTSKRRFVRTR